MPSNTSTENLTTSVEQEQPLSIPETIKDKWTQIIPWVLIFAVFYFFLIRPQEKKRKQHNKLLSALKKGENVITNSGIYGKVVKVYEDDATLEIAISNTTTIRLLRSAIAELPDRKIANKKLSKNNKKDTKETKTEK